MSTACTNQYIEEDDYTFLDTNNFKLYRVDFFIRILVVLEKFYGRQAAL